MFIVRSSKTIQMRRHSQAADTQHIVSSSSQQDTPTLVSQSPDTYSNGSTARQEQEKREIAGDAQEDFGYTHTLVRAKKYFKTWDI